MGERKALLILLAELVSSKDPCKCCRDFLTYDLSTETGEDIRLMVYTLSGALPNWLGTGSI